MNNNNALELLTRSGVTLHHCALSIWCDVTLEGIITHKKWNRYRLASKKDENWMENGISHETLKQK